MSFSSSFSSSSFSTGPGGRVVTTSTTMGPDGKKITKKMEKRADGSAEASIEEIGSDGRVRRKSGQKGAQHLEL